jgi:hypothetical protein
MDARIGVVYTAREQTLETDDTADVVSEANESAFSSGDALLWHTHTNGRKVGVPTDKIAYVEVVTDSDARKVGFSRS